MKNVYLKIGLFITAMLGGTGGVMASDLPPCPSSGYFHNCFGTFKLADIGAEYVGEFKGGIPHGQGTITTNIEKYVGEINAGAMHGLGTFTWANGDEYIGEFRYNNMWEGTLNKTDGTKYVGEFRDNKKNGLGTFTWANGDEYVGEFKNDKQNGQGTLTRTDGTVIAGKWVDNKPPKSSNRKRIIFEGPEETLFDITLVIKGYWLDLREETDPFTKKTKTTHVQGFCVGTMEIFYLGEEDFVFERGLNQDLNLLYDDFATSESSIYWWNVEVDTIYRKNDSIIIDLHPGWSDFYKDPSNQQIEEIKTNSSYRCDGKNVTGVTSAKQNIFSRASVKFRSGKTLEGREFWDHSRVLLEEFPAKKFFQ